MNKILLLSLLLLAGCKAMRADLLVGVPGHFFAAGAGDLNPASDKLSDDCRSSSVFDACLYLKNPVAQQQAPVDLTLADPMRRFGVRIHGLSYTGFLENAHVRVLTLYSPRFSILNSSFKASISDGQSENEQLSAYYWSTHAFEYLQKRLGFDRVPDLGLKIYADDVFTGYSALGPSIHLEKSPGRWSKAFSGEVVIHLLGEALAHRLSGKLFPGSPSNHNTCLQSPFGCCQSANGCSQALASAFGDYVSVLLFPSTPRLGETLNQSAAGQVLCSMPRDLSWLAQKGEAEIYGACTTVGQTGQATLMGAWYAAKWWHLRQQAEAQESGASLDIDKLFFDHAKFWTGDFTFVEAKAQALSLAATYKNGKFQALITSALSGI